MFTSLRVRTVVTLAGLLLLCTIWQVSFSYSAARQIIQQDAIKAVGISAELRRQVLLGELRMRNDRAQYLLRELSGPCANADPTVCARRLRALVSSEPELTGAWVSHQADLIGAGEWGRVGDVQLAAGQLATFGRDWQARPYYLISISSEQGMTLALRFRMAEIDSIFLNRRGLGESGEAFLTDRSAFFLTPVRYAEGAGQSHPIEARPMQMCLRGEDGEALEKDYRGVDIVHGFRQVPEAGGGCIMVHLDQTEAFAPARDLRETLVLGASAFGLGAILLGMFAARALTEPIRALSRTASRVSEGDLDARAPVTRSDEVGHLADTFNAMVLRIQERTEELDALNQELEAFTFTVSHDLRAPLRAIDGFSRVLLQKHAQSLDDEGRRLLTVVRANTQKMGQLIDDLLAFARLGRQHMSPRPVDMRELADGVVRELTADLGQRDVRLSIGALPPAYGDPALLRQVFVNLLSNAMKFTRPRSTAAIEVGAETGGVEVTYYVRDNGVGFDQRYAPKMFGVFERLHTAEEFEGTGVGLAIVELIVRRHGGRVWAEGAIDQGTTISFTLPHDPEGAS